jgi:hypothetical protein
MRTAVRTIVAQYPIVGVGDTDLREMYDRFAEVANPEHRLDHRRNVACHVKPRFSSGIDHRKRH